MNDYFIDTLQGMNGVGGDVRDDDSQIISINKATIANQNATIPVPAHHPQLLYRDKSDFGPEKDPMYDTQQANTLGRRRRTVGANARLEPIQVKSNFLRKGQGNGGSPTNFVLRQQVNETGQVVLEPIAKRQGASSTVRIRGKKGDYKYN